MSLTGKQRRHLRGLGHSLNPVIQVGKEGISESVIAALDDALELHELVKVRLGQNALVDRKDAAEQLAKESGAEAIQVLGFTILLYRRHPEEPKINLPG